jgi:hypothetical protein
MSTAAKPTTVAPGPGAGQGATATLLAGADDGQGVIEVVPGVIPVPGGVLCTLTFGEPYSGQMRATVLPFNNAAAVIANAFVPGVQTPGGASATSLDIPTTTAAALSAAAGKLQLYYQVTPLD